MAASPSEQTHAVSPSEPAQSTADGPAVTAAGPVIAPELRQWKEFLREQEDLCSRHGFPAAVITIGLEGEADMATARGALPDLLRSTDRAGVLCDTELSVVLVPVESIHHAQRLVHMLDGGLRGRGLSPHIGWAMRLEGHGLFHASARADAAMLSSRGHGRPAVDLSGH